MSVPGGEAQGVSEYGVCGFCQFRVRCKVAKVGVEGDEVRWQARLRPNWTSGDSTVEARMTRQDGQRIEAETWRRRG